MSIYAIADLHLSFGCDKPMNIFGDNWLDHENKIRESWIKNVKDDDLVIIPGDFSWAIKLDETQKDFEYLNNLPGQKVFIKGNHDYWWSTIKSMNDFCNNNNYNNISFIMNNAYKYQNYAIVGTRGWAYTNTENSEKMHKRELARLENSIKYAIDNFQDIKEIICAIHYPPITRQMLDEGTKSKYIELMKKYNITTCIYGHLHGKSHNESVEGIVDGVNLKLISSDYLNFELFKLK